MDDSKAIKAFNKCVWAEVISYHTGCNAGQLAAGSGFSSQTYLHTRF